MEKENNEELELELTFLPKELPKNLEQFPSKLIIDYYLSNQKKIPKTRIRKNGNKYEITKKEPINKNDVSVQIEKTIPLDVIEYEMLTNNPNLKKVFKIRYYCKIDNYEFELDIFQEELKGLALIDFEFKTEEEKDKFKIPNFILQDITQESFIAGGMLAGKTYEDIRSKLDQYNYKKLE